MSKKSIYLDSFSGMVVSLKTSLRKNDNNILYALDKHPRVSTWDMSENAWLRSAIKRLKEQDLIREIDEHYPWHKYVLTSQGKEKIAV